MSEATKDRVVRMLKARGVDRQTRDDAIDAALAAYAARVAELEARLADELSRGEA